jgi:hypothetical protein
VKYDIKCFYCEVVMGEFGFIWDGLNLGEKILGIISKITNNFVNFFKGPFQPLPAKKHNNPIDLKIYRSCS